jgi:metal-responsive CopG/Arc/MetJ family transcriptional regulator
MASKKSTPAPTPIVATVDSKGNQRVYVDLPKSLVTKFNVMAAMKGVTKRSYMSSLLAEAINRASAEAGV